MDGTLTHYATMYGQIAKPEGGIAVQKYGREPQNSIPLPVSFVDVLHYQIITLVGI